MSETSIENFDPAEVNNDGLIAILQETQETLDRLEEEYNFFPENLMELERKICGELEIRMAKQIEDKMYREILLELKRRHDERLKEKEG